MPVSAWAPNGASKRTLALAVLIVVSLAVIVQAVAQPPRGGTGEVVAIRELEMKPDASLEQFERFVTGTYNPAWEGAVPGMRGYIAKGDRGANKGRYAFVLIFDSERTRDAIFPKEGAGASDRFGPLLKQPLALIKELDKFIEPGSFSIYTDYVALR
jgi:hypothetical protein